MSKVKVHQKAAKYLQRLPKDSKARIKEILTGLEVKPLEQPHVKHMVGEWAGYHRIRAGKFRII
jgi:mRNA interferase RelE/StbE